MKIPFALSLVHFILYSFRMDIEIALTHTIVWTKPNYLWFLPDFLPSTIVFVVFSNGGIFGSNFRWVYLGYITNALFPSFYWVGDVNWVIKYHWNRFPPEENRGLTSTADDSFFGFVYPFHFQLNRIYQYSNVVSYHRFRYIKTIKSKIELLAFIVNIIVRRRKWILNSMKHIIDSWTI